MPVRHWCSQSLVTSCQYASAPLVQSASFHQLPVSQCVTGAVSLLSPAATKPVRRWCSQHFVTSFQLANAPLVHPSRLVAREFSAQLQLVIK